MIADMGADSDGPTRPCPFLFPPCTIQLFLFPRLPQARNPSARFDQRARGTTADSITCRSLPIPRPWQMGHRRFHDRPPRLVPHRPIRALIGGRPPPRPWTDAVAPHPTTSDGTISCSAPPRIVFSFARGGTSMMSMCLPCRPSLCT